MNVFPPLIRTTLCVLLLQGAVAAPLAALEPDAPVPPARSAVLVVADGLGWGHLQLWRETCLRRNRTPAMSPLWDQGHTGVATVRPPGSLVPESAGGASALSTGEEVPNESVSMTADGRRPPTLVERARRRGRSAGVVTTGRLTHAVPASFLVHAPDRDPEMALAGPVLASGAEVLLGGGSEYFSKAILAGAVKRGLRVVRTAKELSAFQGKAPLLGLFAPDYFPYALDRTADAAVPSLADMTRSALTALSSDPDGFLLVLDARLIDESSHNNDAAALLAEMDELDRTLGVVLDFARSRKDVLVVMTSPHDTGGPAVVSAANPLDWTDPSRLDAVLGQKASFRTMFAALWELEQEGKTVDASAARRGVEPMLAPETRLEESDYASLADAFRGSSKQELFHHGPANRELARVLEKIYRIRWTTGTHTNGPVPLFAWGPGADAFSGWLSAPEISRRLAALLGL